MIEFNSKYQEVLCEKWKSYIVENKPFGEDESEIRPFIYESWKRSKAFSVDPFGVKDDKLPEHILKKIIEKNQLLISVAHPYLMGIYKYVKGSNFVLALTDANGIVVDLVGDDRIIQSRTKKSGLAVGADRSEKHSGTSGIGTCLAEGRPLQIWGEEHYIEPHHNYICTAAPIRNKEGEIIGCLDAVGPREISQIHTLAMVNASVDGIEKELKMMDAYAEISLINKQLSSTLQAISSGILMLDNSWNVTQYNNRVAAILKMSVEDIKNKNLTQILDVKTFSIDFWNLSKDVFSKEVSVVNSYGTRLSFSMSATIVKNAAGAKVGVVLALEEIKHIHKLVNKLSGFSATYTFDSILSTSSAMHTVKNLAMAAAQSCSNVLILGESGTGKELLAQSIHNASDRAKGPFIAINCGSLPKGLIESELFGYERGAFTGANKEGHPGKFELAEGGTIFLDEIGDMPLELQTSLLRVLQSKEIIRIGGKYSKQIDVRIMAATNVNLLECVKEKKFRNDLYYRLNVLSIQVPPLRNRPEDISILVNAFLAKMSLSLHKSVEAISPEAMALLFQYSWPGNVRELENVIERAVNLCEETIIATRDLPDNIIMLAGVDSALYKSVFAGELPAMSRQLEQSHGYLSEIHPEEAYINLVNALKSTNGNVSKAAQLLNMPRRTLYRRIEKYNINTQSFRNI